MKIYGCRHSKQSCRHSLLQKVKSSITVPFVKGYGGANGCCRRNKSIFSKDIFSLTILIIYWLNCSHMVILFILIDTICFQKFFSYFTNNFNMKIAFNTFNLQPTIKDCCFILRQKSMISGYTAPEKLYFKWILCYRCSLKSIVRFHLFPTLFFSLSF